MANKLKMWTNDGVCLLCGKKAGKMSKDHIPPQCCGNNGKVILEPYVSDAHIKPRACKNGLVFETICEECNNLLGDKYDYVLGEFANDVKRILESQLIYPYPQLNIRTKPTKLIKAILGHTVATMNHIGYNNNDVILQDIRDYVLSNRTDAPKNVHIIYWLFPYPDVIISRNSIVLWNYFEQKICSILKFYPLAFAVVYDKLSNTHWQDLMPYANNCDEEQIRTILLTMPHKALPYNFPDNVKYGIILSPTESSGYIAVKQ